MADKKISQLSSASALTGAEPLAIVQDGVTKKTTVQDVADLSVLFPSGLKEVYCSSTYLSCKDFTNLSIEVIFYEMKKL